MSEVVSMVKLVVKPVGQMWPGLALLGGSFLFSNFG